MSERPRILLVDDEVAIQRAVAPLLRSRGYDVETAGSAAQALGHRIKVGPPEAFSDQILRTLPSSPSRGKPPQVPV